MYNQILEGLSIQPREYQRRLVEKSLACYAGDWRDDLGRLLRRVDSVLVQAPTGAGKTIIALQILKGLALSYPDVAERGIIWTAMRRNLLAQAEAENIAKGFHLPIQFISTFSHDIPRTGILVYDECQHEAAASARNFWEAAQPTYTLGLSATPQRHDRQALCFQTSVQDYGIHELVQEGYLSRYHHFSVQEWTPEHVADVYLRWREKWGKSLVYFRTHHECNRFASLLTQAGCPVEVVTASSDREAQLERFEAGDVDVCVNMMVLTEGYNFPALKTVFVRDSGKWPTIQMAGRVFRKHDDVTYKQVVQATNTKFPFEKYVRADTAYVYREGHWMALRANPYHDQMANEMMRAILESPEAKIPKYFGQSLKHRNKGVSGI